MKYALLGLLVCCSAVLAEDNHEKSGATRITLLNCYANSSCNDESTTTTTSGLHFTFDAVKLIPVIGEIAEGLGASLGADVDTTLSYSKTIQKKLILTTLAGEEFPASDDKALVDQDVLANCEFNGKAKLAEKTSNAYRFLAIERLEELFNAREYSDGKGCQVKVILPRNENGKIIARRFDELRKEVCNQCNLNGSLEKELHKRMDLTLTKLISEQSFQVKEMECRTHKDCSSNNSASFNGSRPMLYGRCVVVPNKDGITLRQRCERRLAEGVQCQGFDPKADFEDRDISMQASLTKCVQGLKCVKSNPLERGYRGFNGIWQYPTYVCKKHSASVIRR